MNEKNTQKYEIERLLSKKVVRNNIYYLVKWKDYFDVWNTWYHISNLQHVLQLISKFERNSQSRTRRSIERFTRLLTISNQSFNFFRSNNEKFQRVVI